jgi:hypothetical protein
MLAPWIAMASPAPRSNRTQMGRTYVLAVLVLICAAYLFRTKYGRPRSGLEAAKEKIENISKQPTAHDDRTAFFAATPHAGTAAASAETSDPARVDAQPPGTPGEDAKVTHLAKGTFTVVDGMIIYSADAQLDIGHGRLVSSPTGVMVSDADQLHIAGDLVIEGPDGTTTAEDAFITVDKEHMEMTSNFAGTVQRETRQP